MFTSLLLANVSRSAPLSRVPVAGLVPLSSLIAAVPAAAAPWHGGARADGRCAGGAQPAPGTRPQHRQHPAGTGCAAFLKAGASRLRLGLRLQNRCKRVPRENGGTHVSALPFVALLAFPISFQFSNSSLFSDL